MGLFITSKQNEINKKAEKVYRGMLVLSDKLNESGGVLTPINNFYLGEVENACYDYMVTLKENQYSITHVMWNGKKTPVMHTLIAVQGFLGEISQSTGYTFKKLN